MVFVGVLILTALVVFLVGLLVDSTGLSATDRMLGVIFGLARGAVIVALLVLFAGFTAIPRDRWWRESILVPHFETLAIAVRDMLPPEVAEHLTYGGAAVAPPPRAPAVPSS
jgi:membrane protein required for colicin V production